MSRAAGRLALMAWWFLATAVTHTAEEPITAKVDQVFAKWNLVSSPGCALAVVKEGRIVYEKGYGMANLELGAPITPHTVFDIGSVSKQFTAMSIVLLEQDGKLALDDDIRKYLPEIPDYGSRITIRHLLYHTSGLRDYDDLFDLVGIPEIDLTTDRDAMQLIARQKGVNFKPGEEFLYSDTNFFLLSEIVERVTGKTLRLFAQERIFGPLGMSSTHFHDDHTMIVPRRATGYAPHNGGGFEIDMSNFEQLGDGSVMTTVEDLYKWDQNFYHLVVGGPDGIRQLTTPGTLANGQPISYGMGLFIDRYHGLRWIHHSGEWVGYRAALSRFPDQHFSIMITCNCVGSMNPSSMAARIADIYLTDQFKKTEKPGSVPPASLADQDLSRFVGAYWSEKTGALRRFTVEDGMLVMNAPGRSVETIPLSDGEFEYHSDDSERKGKYVFRQSRPGGSYQLQAFEDGAQVWYNPVKDSDLRPDRLANYVGTYFNDELRATWQLVAARGKLIRQQWMNEDQELQPAFNDAFVGDLSEGEFLMHFSRNANGQVTGFQVSSEMVRPMTFVKVEAGAKSDQRFGSE